MEYIHTHTHMDTDKRTRSHTHKQGNNVPGRGNSIFLSILPGLIKAGSRLSMRFVAMITFNIKTNIIRIRDRNIYGDQSLDFKETVDLLSEEVRRADRNTEK
jgi:hypothetical protein